ncbi:peptide-N4-(N-acetyl-beta- glucosaminyl)asparagine amidase [Tritrichomonas musculus]|uniref:Peptide-N4-(N-acetyl-beta-glucosaminyl)asparagine amidase n=1 Tax=Tritrichomonas musculus TaxID=1915356 RepID=A0ABR2K0T6_9EUKA
MVKIIIYYHNHLIQLEASPTASISLLFPVLKNAFQLKGTNSDYYLWASEFHGFEDEDEKQKKKLCELGNLHEARFFLIDKADKEKFDPFLKNILPSMICEAAKLKESGIFIVSSINMMYKFILNSTKEGVAEKVLSIIPFDRIDPFEGDAKVAEITKWFKEDFFTYVKELPCHICGSPTIRENDTSVPSYPTEEEASSGVERFQIFKCKSTKCGALSRFPCYINVCKLLDVKKGLENETIYAFAAILINLGYEIRLVKSINGDSLWVEYWSDEKGRYINIDPCENIIDQQFLNEKKMEKPESWVIAVGENQCVDVTLKYAQNIDKCIHFRKHLCPEEWYTNYIKFKNEELLYSIENEEERKAILEHQQKDIESLKKI